MIIAMQFVYKRLFFSFLTTNLASEKKKIIFSLISYPRPLVVVVKNLPPVIYFHYVRSTISIIKRENRGPLNKP